MTATVGVAIGDRSTADELLRDADLALYRAKEAGRDRYEVFGPCTVSGARIHTGPLAVPAGLVSAPMT